MQHNDESPALQASTNKPLVKGSITAALILLLLIPTWFISGLVNERQARQAEVVNDVCSKWALAQTVTGPYIYLPYRGAEKDAVKHLWLLPDDLTVTGSVQAEQRPRSIYKVLLYRTGLTAKGNFAIVLPKDVDPSSLLLNEAKICVGISDFKGIEKQVDLRFNGKAYNLLPGLPASDIDSSGLSASIDLSPADFGRQLLFDLPLQLKGSQQLHFVPLAGNSRFQLQSAWPNPSFDGTSIPAERKITNAGFAAEWVFNKANLPFTTLVRPGGISKAGLRFGVSMLQPADQYAKTTRSVKYAILIIGLTFSLFFIIELMQKKPMHPVQYVLIGLALVIFYTLLLSISEFILFDYAYLVAAAATIILISFYAKAHFRSWKTAGIFASLLTGLYGFIFVLIRLEDTALLIGSIGLFLILALVMYASRKINWYPSPQPSTVA
ncbi:MAG: cell envelope integrity protein CreD [Chitinophagaceae bacterium]|nr:cell envelope integrity protein CreD [Chitinophagaceae bacterium]